MFGGIGIDSFSYHRFFGEVALQESPTSIRWTLEDFLHRASVLDVDAVSLQTAYLPEIDSASAAWIRGQLKQLELEVVLAWGHRFGLKDGNSPHKAEQLRSCLSIASDLGCSMLRFVAGAQNIGE